MVSECKRYECVPAARLGQVHRNLTARTFCTRFDLGNLTNGGSGWHHLDPGGPQRPSGGGAARRGQRIERDGVVLQVEEQRVNDVERSAAEWETPRTVESASERAAESPADLESHTASYDDTPIAAMTHAAIRALTGRGPAMPRPARRRTIVVANQKGGVGKTTTAVNLAAALAINGGRVLVIDLDPQGNASTALGVDHYTGVTSVYEVIIEGRPLEDVVRQCEAIPNLSCVPATIDLAGAEIELVSLVARESRLRKAMEAYSHDVDYIFIDCPPSLGLLTINALVAASELLIPIQCEYYALEGLGQLLKNVDLVKAHLNSRLTISTIVLTMYDGRTRLASQVADEVRQHFAGVVLKTTIPRSVRISEAPSYGQTVITYDPVSTGALSYMEAAREIAVNGQTGDAPPAPRPPLEQESHVEPWDPDAGHLDSDSAEEQPSGSQGPSGDSSAWQTAWNSERK